MNFGQELKDLVLAKIGTLDGNAFQKAMKQNHPLAMEYIARLMRRTRKANGPLLKGKERRIFKPAFQGEKQSIYPRLSREAVLLALSGLREVGDVLAASHRDAGRIRVTSMSGRCTKFPVQAAMALCSG